MPFYTFQCRKCREEFEEFLWLSELETSSRSCPFCKSKKVEQTITKLKAPSVIPFRADFYPNLDLDPIYCDTPQQLYDEAKKRDLYVPYLESSIHRIKRGRWV